MKMRTNILILLILNINWLVRAETLKNTPTCHHGIMRLFHWCEQSECTNCTCLSKNHVCKQICNRKKCDQLFCSSPQTCYQSLLVEYGKRKPVVDKLISHTPITQQDCSQSSCKLMKAIRYGKTVSRSFQSCSEGKCGEVNSNTDIAKQFCGDCDKMECSGTHARNCTQLCVFGKCKEIICNAKHCKQLCSHDSTCHLTCGPNAEICEQTCNHGSICNMKCLGKSCKQKCDDAKNCTIVHVTKYKPTTTRTTTTSTTTAQKKPTTTTTTTSTTTTTTTEIDNNIIVILEDEKQKTFEKEERIKNNNNVEVSSFTQTPSSAVKCKLQPVMLLTLTTLTIMILCFFFYDML